jgi:carbon-monoxide dehydrogenase medium subunit
LAADATLVLLGTNGKREVTLAEFLKGPGKTSLDRDEVLIEVVVPTERSGCHSRFLKVGRRKSQAISIINLAGCIDIGQDGLVSDVRIALGAVAPTVVRAHRAEGALTGKQPSAKNLAEAAALAAEECRPISDIRATGSGRKLLVEAWTLRLLETLCDTSGKESG